VRLEPSDRVPAHFPLSLSISRSPWRIWIGVAVVIVAALGAYDIFHDPAGDWRNYTHTDIVFHTVLGVRTVPSAPLWLAVVAALAIAHTLIVSGDADRAYIAEYSRLFDITWKHTVQVALAGAFVGALRVMLFLGGALFSLRCWLAILSWPRRHSRK
jgi:hypothetical protein